MGQDVRNQAWGEAGGASGWTMIGEEPGRELRAMRAWPFLERDPKRGKGNAGAFCLCAPLHPLLPFISWSLLTPAPDEKWKDIE